MQLITRPEPRTLFPPLLACLPTAFLSPRPPPALLPLLSPILRQRVALLSANTSSGNGGWLSLLSWDSKRASKLGGKIENLQLEAHPVSGELELEDIDKIGFRRVDEETLQACLQVEEFGLLPVYVWCENDEHANGGPGWKVAELRSLEDLTDDGDTWQDSIAAANDVFESTTHPDTAAAAAAAQDDHEDDDDDDDDDDYWNSYDQTPGRTPARTPPAKSPAPPSTASSFPPNTATAEEVEYFARYASEVQPALDSHDPDEEHPETGDSTLRGGEMTYTAPAPEPNTNPAPPMFPASATDTQQAQREAFVTAPRATSPSTSPSSVDKLEKGAEDMTRAEVGVKQFVSTEMKSMFRLARSVGMGREEFERIIKTELEVLSMMEADD